MANAEHEPVTGVCRLCPQRDPGQSRWSGDQGVEPYAVFTIARRYADHLRAATALSRHRRTQRISHHICGSHGVVLCRDYAITVLSRRHSGIRWRPAHLLNTSNLLQHGVAVCQFSWKFFGPVLDRCNYVY